MCNFLYLFLFLKKIEYIFLILRNKYVCHLFNDDTTPSFENTIYLIILKIKTFQCIYLKKSIILLLIYQKCLEVNMFSTVTAI